MTVANIITAGRVALFVLFIGALLEEWMTVAFLAFGLAWGLDAIDGWVARWLGQTTAFGYVFDKVVDRMVLAVGLLMLLGVGAVPWWTIFLATKDLLLAPLGTLLYWRGQPVQGLGGIGKVVSVLQGLGLLWVWLRLPLSGVAVLLVALLGMVAVGQFWYEQLRVSTRVS